MEDLDDDPLQPFNKSNHINETVQSLQRNLCTKENEPSHHTPNLHSDITKLKHKIQTLKVEREEENKQHRDEVQRSLDSAFRQYEKNVQFIRNRHQDNIKTLQAKHEEELQVTTNKYEEQITQLRRQIQELPNLRISLQSKEDEISTLQDEIKNNKKNCEERVNKLIRDLEDEKVEEQAEKWDLKKYVEIFKKRCLVLENNLDNLQKTNCDLKDKIKEANKCCEIKIAKAKIDYETRARSMEEEVLQLRKDLEAERQNASKELHKMTQKIENDHVTYESKILMLSGHLEEAKKCRQTLETRNTELEGNLSIFRDAVTKIKDQYEVTLKEVRIQNELKSKSHKKELDNLAKKITDLKGITASGQTFLKDEEVQTASSEIPEKLWEFTQHLEDIEQKFSKEKSDYENTISRLTTQMEEQKECFSKIIQLKQQLEMTSINLESSSESNRKYFKEFIKLKKDFETAKKYYEVQLRKHHQEIQKYQNLNKDLSQRYEKLKKDYDHQMKNSSGLQKRRQELETANNEMRSKFSQTTKAIDAHMEILKVTIDENKTFYMETVLQLKKQIEDLMLKNQTIETQMEKRLTQKTSALKEDFDNLEKERNNLLQKLQLQKEAIHKISAELETQKEATNKLKNEHIQDLSKLREHYEKEMKHTDDLILILTNDLEHNNKKYNKLKSLKAKTISKTKSQIGSLQKTYEAKIKDLQRELQGSRKILEETTKHLQKEIENLEASKHRIEEDNQTHLKKISDLEALTESLKREIQNVTLKEDKTDYETTITELKSAIESNKKEYDEYTRKLKEDIKRGKTYIEQLIKIKSSLELKLGSYEKKMSTLHKYVNDTFMKYNMQLTQELSLDEVTTFERKMPQTTDEL